MQSFKTIDQKILKRFLKINYRPYSKVVLLYVAMGANVPMDLVANLDPWGMVGMLGED